MSAPIADNVVEDVLQHFTPSTSTNLVVTCHPHGGNAVNGDIIPPSKATDIPTVAWNAHPGSLYTLALVDPDAPSRAQPKLREWLHWLVANIPGDNIAQGETIAEYVPPMPPQGTGPHRYVFVLSRQPGRVTVPMKHISKKDLQSRGGFTLRELLHKLNMTPESVKFFKAEWDGSVAHTKESLKA